MGLHTLSLCVPQEPQPFPVPPKINQCKFASNQTITIDNKVQHRKQHQHQQYLYQDTIACFCGRILNKTLNDIQQHRKVCHFKC